MAVLLTALALANAPYLNGYLIRPSGTLFYAVPAINYADATQYLALTRMAAEAGPLVGSPFTTEPHAPRLFIPLVLVEAGLCRALGWTPLEAHQASRLLCGAFLLAAGWWLGTLSLRTARSRGLYLALLCFSAGLGWLLLRLGVNIPNGDFLQPEGNTFHTLGNLPHLSLSGGLMAVLFGTLPALERDLRRGRKVGRWIGVTAAGSLLLSWTHPFDFLALGLGLGSYGVLCWVAERRLPRASAAHAAALFVGALPAGAYLLWLTRTDPVYRALANDTLRVQPLAFYAIAHALLALPALLVLATARLRKRHALLLCWVVGAFLFLLAPLPLGGKQCRVVGGIHVPLALLAAAGLDHLTRRMERGRAGRPAALAVGAGFLLIAGSGAWGILERHFRVYAPRGADHYLAPAVQELYRRLEREGDRFQVTLGGPYSGSWAPVFADTRAFHGHWHMTLNQAQKGRERSWLYTWRGVDAQKAAWLRERRIDWVIWYPAEWSGWAVSLDGVPGLRPVYQAPELVLYRVE